MNKKKLSWIYVTVAIIILGILFLLIAVTYQNRIQLSLPVYFILLIICDLAATAFLTQALTSSAEWSGTIMRGNLKISGAAVIFILILLIGYKYRPQEKEAPFDLSILVPGIDLSTSKNKIIRIEFGNNPREENLDKLNKAVFLDIDARYRGTTVRISSDIDDYRISTGRDTLVTIPSDPLPAIRFEAIRKNDSSLFSGDVIHAIQNKPAVALPGVVVSFIDFDRQVKSDSAGHFRITLLAKTGDPTGVTILTRDKKIISQRVVLSKKMQILINE